MTEKDIALSDTSSSSFKDGKPLRILIFDNYDSFTYTLVHLVEDILHQKVEGLRNEEIALEKIKEFDKIILSPGPGIPSEAGLLLPLIKEYASSKSILGVCLGHQAIGEAFGATLINLDTVYHGVATKIKIESKKSKKKKDLFKDLTGEIEAGSDHTGLVS